MGLGYRGVARGMETFLDFGWSKGEEIIEVVLSKCVRGFGTARIVY
jgi:hypothetical protein